MGASAAYVVLSHLDPARVERMVERILALSPGACVLVRHDARRAAAPRITSPRVVVEAHRGDRDWGSWELVDQTRHALHRAAELFDPRLLIVVSGQDYPCRDLAGWERGVLAGGAGWVCAFLHELHYRPRWGRPYGDGDDTLTRYLYRWYPLPAGRWLHRSSSSGARALRWAATRVGHYLEPIVAVRTVTRGRGYHVGIRARKTPFDDAHPCLMGSQWMALDRASLAAIDAAFDHDRLMRATYRRSIIPDESAFQTVLGWRQPPQPGGIVSHTVWEAALDAPRTLTIDDLDEILASGAPFCRKLAAGLSDELADALDRLAPTR